MSLPGDVKDLDTLLTNEQPAIRARDTRYRNEQKLRFAADEVQGDLGSFGLPLCRLAVDAVAERMRITRIAAAARGRDVSTRANELWRRSQFDQLLTPLIADTLALGSAYVIGWTDHTGRACLTPESARNVVARRDPVTGETVDALKRWEERGVSGDIRATHRVHYRSDYVEHYRDNELVARYENSLGVVPVVPLINAARIGDMRGSSVIDDLGDLVDAQAKILADMLVASEDVARPRRWATGVELEDDYEEGFSADGGGEDNPLEGQAVSPFADGNRMFTVESPDASFGQLPGADLKGYETAVDLITRQIMAVSALPAHMMGITSSNVSADAFRAAEASLTARAEARIGVLGIQLERAAALLIAADTGISPADIEVTLTWANPATRSDAQAADAASKLFALGLIDRDEAREMMGIYG